jgi:hypothetical protein
MPMVTIILGALAAMSPFLRKIIMPILNRDSGSKDGDTKPE